MTCRKWSAWRRFKHAQINSQGWSKGEGGFNFKTIASSFSKMVELIVLPCSSEQAPVIEYKFGRNLSVIDTMTYVCATVRARAMKSPTVYVASLIEPFTNGELSGK